MSVRYRYGENGDFIIGGYDKAEPFASFLPGIAGLDGIPMWSFYVNRGQAMGSFGVRDKNGAIMEFFPANIMVRNIERLGFRTFVKRSGEIRELFSSAERCDAERSLTIGMNRIEVVEANRALGLKATVTYFTMPGEGYAAIARKLAIERFGFEGGELEVLDGLPQILPHGVTNGEYQAMGNLMRAWFDVTNLESGIPYYKVRASTGDTEKVSEMPEGNFYLAFSTGSGGLLRPIYDMNVVFGRNTALSLPDGWDCPVEDLCLRDQVAVNKVSGGFAGERVAAGAPYALYSVIGHAESPEAINGRKAGFTPEFIERKLKEAEALAERLVENTDTHTSDPVFDRYIAQSNLDNVLRGGYPLVFDAGGKNHVFHVYSRKHGDLEREYNFFSLEPGYYSQGNGNFRDVCQNRRNDVLLNPAVGDFNLRHFLSLIQADGYNPLQVKGCTFFLEPRALPGVLALVRSGADAVAEVLAGAFTPGQLLRRVEGRGVALAVPREKFLQAVLANCRQDYEAEFGEGYWSDHWTYIMDLVDTFLTVYPDREEEFLFGSACPFFHTDVYVLPRSAKYVLDGGRVRQYGALVHGARGTGWLKTAGGEGGVYEASPAAKLLLLALVKFTTLDPLGMGMEMEAGRPGWNDALNGLPGLFGSGVGETAELLRLVTFLRAAFRESDRELPLFAEAAQLFAGIGALLDRYAAGEVDDFGYWERAAARRETYRAKIRHGIDGAEVSFRAKDFAPILGKMAEKLADGLRRALGYGGGIHPTYFTYEAAGYEPLPGVVNPANALPCVRVTGFECRPLPLFLEGPARVLKTMGDAAPADRLHAAVKSSALYDRALGMYKTSGPLEGTSREIGRLFAFTPGWLERESVFLHMEYKYLFAELKAGLHGRFIEDMATALVPFMRPEVYGRSTLENSSFIASSANPDPAVRGRGFVARLSGSTAETLSIWFMMMAGDTVFRVRGGELTLALRPILPGHLFREDGTVRFRFLGRTAVTYHNAGRRDTFGARGAAPVRYELTAAGREPAVVDGPVIGAPHAAAVRDGQFDAIDVTLA